MKICRGEINGVKCQYFDEEFLSCNNNDRSGIIKEDLKYCKHYKKFINEIVTSEDENEQEIFKNFISLKNDEQLFVFYLAVEKMEKVNAIMKIHKEITITQAKNKAKYLLTKPRIINAITEFMESSTEKIIQIQSTNIALKLMDASSIAVDDMIKDFNKKTIDVNGNRIVKANDIIMAGKIHADTYSKYKKVEGISSNNINLFTFGDGKTLAEVIGNIKKLPEKIIDNE